LVLILGFAAFAGSIYTGISDAESGLLQMLAPGVADLFSSIFISLAALFGSIAIAAVITLVTDSIRKRAFLRLKEEERQIRGFA
jgi:hypothetical protein